MRHFALIDENNLILNVIVVSEEDCGNKDFPESDIIGSNFCNTLIPGNWKETSEFGLFRGRFASPGDIWDPITETFQVVIN